MAEEVEVVGSATEQSGATSAGESSSAHESSADAVYLQVSRDELATLLETTAHDAAASAVESVNASLSSQLDALSADVSSLGTVTLVSNQYDELVSLGSTGLHVGVVSVGLLSLLLGAVVATAITMHWRGRG